MIIGASVRLSDSVPSCGGWPWLYFVVRSSDRVVVVDVDLLTAGCIEEIAGRRGKGQCTGSRGPGSPVSGDNTGHITSYLPRYILRLRSKLSN